MQDSSIAIPNGSFENWSTGNGYSVTVLFFSLPVYSSYTYPTNWDYPTYPVNENITYSGMNVNVNTNLPLMKLSDETGTVPNGAHALKLQSFMLSDIINSTVYRFGVLVGVGFCGVGFKICNFNRTFKYTAFVTI